ncbi:MAG: hypothetical protein L3J57_10350 [Desulfuromusa sp.]|nr:hypothetical protein [Desulfuromusa sp.]
MDENDKRFIENLFVKQTEQFQEYIGVISENFDHKLAIIAEGHQMLSEKLERVESSLGLKIDKIAAEVTAHRADTEAHHGVWRVKEAPAE